MNRSPAPLARRLLSVTANQPLGAYRVLRVADPDMAPPQAGRFAMLAAAERWGAGEDQRPYLPRAFSYARFVDGEAHFLLEDVGPGTNRLCELQEGEQLWLLGPLGSGFLAPTQGRRAILLAGGIGIAPLVIWQEQLRQTSAEDPLTLLGFRNEACAQGAQLISGALTATDDGSIGHHGPVTDLLSAALQEDPNAVVYACGPPAMLEALRAICAERGVAAQLALEAGMACGFGACFGCVVPVRGGGYLRVCLDGPVLDAALLEHVHCDPGGPA